jgi:GAF domain-containing protein
MSDLPTWSGVRAACLPLNEKERLRALRRLRLLDSPVSAAYDRVTRLAAKALGVPIALISLVDADRQWFLSRVGTEVTETSRDISFCAHAVYECRPMVIPDATADVRFAGNSLVIGAPHIRAYAGIPIYTRAGYAMGSLCAIDTKTRQFSEDDVNALRDCAFIVEDLLQTRERTLAGQLG